jgi:hypothetical protein
MKIYQFFLLGLLIVFIVPGTCLFAENEDIVEGEEWIEEGEPWPKLEPASTPTPAPDLDLELELDSDLESDLESEGLTTETAPTRNRGVIEPSSILDPSEGTKDLLVLINLVGSDDPEITAAVKQFIIAQFGRERQILQERRNVLKHHYTVGMVIFITVHLVVVIGIGAAIYEFRQAHKTRKRAEQQETEIQVSLEGIALKTSLQGVLLLGFALAFYFLYVEFVFPVTLLK